MKPAFWARRAHKWIALIVGVQALLWMISGLYMTVISIEVIHGDHLAHTHSEPLSTGKEWLTPVELAARFPEMTAFRVKRLLEEEVVEVHHGGEVTLVDARSGNVLSPIDENTARRLADTAYSGEAPIAQARWITEAPQEVATRPVPMWAVDFADDSETTLYFSPYSGELLARRHDLWRWFDFLWMFHIMDYESRTDVNNTLLRVASAMGLLFALSGIWLLLYSFSRRRAQA